MEKEIISKHEQPKKWLYKSVKYNVLMHYRKNHITLCEFEEIAGGNVDKAYEKAESLQTLKTILSQEEYYIVHKIYFGGFAERDLAKELHITENAVRMRMIKIKKKIAKNIYSFYPLAIFIFYK